jgi:hypothetical protein
MNKDDQHESNETSDSEKITPPEDKAPDARPKEIGGPKGLEPTRYGDWEKAGRCIDF